MLQKIEGVVGEREDVFAGSALTSDGTMVEVFATPQASAIVDELRASIGREFNDLVRVVPVARSMDQLLAAQNEILSNDDLSHSIQAIAPDVPENGLVVSTAHDASAEDIAALTDRIADLQAQPTFAGLKIRIRPGGQGELAIGTGGARTSQDWLPFLTFILPV